ncbi:MAG: acyl carrier protein phosphodiesterase [Deltaproteobacteria bacterium]|nr:acyl carrier protein phosphodiesterase [Deltaproteobacteria bacterium]
MGTIETLTETYGTDIARGIRHHREVDRFTDTHDAVVHSVKALQTPFGLYGSIVVDVIFDHFLLTRWNDYARIRKDLFFASVYQSLSLPHPAYPPRFTATIDRILERRWLNTYEKLENVAYALMRIGERFNRPTPLKDALPGLQTHYAVLEQDFIRFFPDLQDFSEPLVETLLYEK